MARIVGIDLGTTYSAIATLVPGGKPEILVNRDGERIMPSVVMFQGESSVLVGSMAKRSAATAPLDVVQFIKRQMGNPDWRFETSEGAQFTAEEISAIILKRLKDDAELHFGEGEVTDAVITVPAYFDDARRRATIDAGRIAGLNVRRVLNEPTAAALAFGLDTQAEGTYLCFDLGGGTFDVTVMKIGDATFEVLGTDGLHECGGFEWDNRLMSWLNEEFQKEGGIDLTEDFSHEADLRERAELAKRTLSQAPNARVALSDGGVSKILTVSRETFEDITKDLVNQARDLSISLVEELGLSWTDMQGTLLVGGSTRMPMVKKMLEEVTGKPPLRSGNPDELVALGAAIQAGIEAADDEGSAPGPSMNGRLLAVLDVTSQGLGTIVMNDDRREENTVIISRNSKIPCKEAREFSTMHDGQTELRLRVTQGDDRDPGFVVHIGEQTLSIPPYPAGSPVRVIFSFDIDQTVHIEVIDLATDKSLGSFEVDNIANLSDEDVVAAAKKNKNLEVN